LPAKQTAARLREDAMNTHPRLLLQDVTRSVSRADRFLARIDKYLPTVTTDQARRTFLAKQIKAWQARYSEFITTAGSSESVTDTRDPPQASDFLLTIIGLKARRDAMVS
jgi:hypothetical protein